MSGPPPIPSAGLSPVLPVQPFAGSSFPPPVPPNDTFTPSVTNKSGIRRLYNLFKRAKSDTGSKNGKNKGIIRKIKGLFASLKLKKKVNVDPSSNVLAINQSSNTENEDGTNDGIAQPATTSPETTAQPHQNEAQTSHQSAQEMGKAQNETSISPADSTDLFHQAVIDAQKRADRLGSTTQILRVLAEGLTVGAATWMPGVGEAASMVLAMVSTAEKISLGKVAALRLVERSAIVLEAIEQTIIQHEGQLLPGMLEHVNKLLAHLHQNNQFLVKLSERSFLKLYLHSDEIDRRLSAANEDLSDFVDIFHLQAQISLAAWEEQSRVDREEDMRILLRKLDEARETDEKILESQQDIINTLQKITLTANSTTQVEQNRSNRLTVTASESTELSYTTATEGEIPEEQRLTSPITNDIPLPEHYDDISSSSGSLLSIPPHLETQPSFESDRAERHYRHYLSHGFDDRLSIALWFPSVVPLGSIGFVRNGQFVHIMDAHMPPIGIKQLPPMPYLDEFSAFQTIKVAVNERGNTEKGLEMVATISNSLKLSAEESKAPCRRISFPLKPGMKQAALIVEDGTFEIYKSLTQAKLYLATNINWILEQYGDRYHICKEDVIMVVGTLIARDWAMMISGFRPQTTLTFNVRAPSDRVEGETWGNWTVSYGEKGLEKNMAAELDKKDHKFSCKVSRVLSFSPNAVLLARLKFPPAGLEPTLYP